MGKLVIRAPVASWTAFAIAAGGAIIGGSPTPLIPNAPSSAGVSKITYLSWEDQGQ